jgi:hypothetical protein
VAFAEEVIDGLRYELRPMDPMKVLEHGSKLTAIVAAPALAQVNKLGGVEAGPDALGQVVGVFASFAGEALKHMAHPDVQSCIRELFNGATVDLGGDKQLELAAAWKTHFLGKTGAMVKFLAWALGAQYGDFFGAMQTSLVDALKRRFASLASQASATAPQSPST